MEAVQAHCPLCDGVGIFARALDASDIRQQLGEVFGLAPPDQIGIADYAMHTCANCTLVFASPMRAGDSEFYAWISGFTRYNATHRWEWRTIKDIVARETRSVRLLEIGCGDGAFLHSIADLEHVRAMGIDRSATSVAAARKRGIVAHEVDLESVGDNDDDIASFDVIVATHLLEHIEQPLDFVIRCARRLNPGGCLLVSTPYSPMSRELLRNDIMNLPPHHLTRWNEKSWRALAALAGLQIELIVPRAKPALMRAVRQTCIKVTGMDRRFPIPERIAILAANAPTFVRILGRALHRERLDGRTAPDKILARLTKHSVSPV